MPQRFIVSAPILLLIFVSFNATITYAKKSTPSIFLSLRVNRSNLIPSNAIRTDLILAKQYIDNYKFFQAEPLLLSILELAPTTYTAKLYLADLYLKELRLNESLDIIQSLLYLTSSDYRIHRILGEIHFCMNNYKQAKNEFLTALRLKSADIESKDKLNMLYKLQRRSKIYENKLKHSARLAEFKWQLDKSEKLWKKIIEMSSNDLDARINLFSVYVKMGNLNLAEKELNYCKRFKNLPDNFYYVLSALYERQRAYLSAITALEKAVKMNPLELSWKYKLNGLRLRLEMQ